MSDRALHIVHISSAHHAGDPRIRLKQLGSIVKAGWRASFVTGDPAARSGDDGVEVIRSTRRSHSRIVRMMVIAPLSVWRAIRLDADVYHIHDPELIVWAHALRFKRRPIVYDVHEDYATGLAEKSWIPRPLRQIATAILSPVEDRMTRAFQRVIAERYYAQRFPDALPVLNYPVTAGDGEGAIAHSRDSRALLYTGNVTERRGALGMAEFAASAAQYEVTVAGRCSADLAARMRQVAGDGNRRLHITGIDRFVPFSEIESLYAQPRWLAGLVLVPDNLFMRQKQLTKFFEFMQAGLPIIASDFPAWRELIVGEGVGLCVDPNDIQAVIAAADWLATHQDEAERMAHRGLALARARFNWATEERKLLRLYRELDAAAADQ